MVDLKDKAVSPDRGGHRQDRAALGIENLYDADRASRATSSTALKAQLYKRDRDYVVKDGEIVIVDEFTGRMMPGRRWSEGSTRRRGQGGRAGPARE